MKAENLIRSLLILLLVTSYSSSHADHLLQHHPNGIQLTPRHTQEISLLSWNIYTATPARISLLPLINLTDKSVIPSVHLDAESLADIETSAVPDLIHPLFIQQMLASKRFTPTAQGADYLLEIQLLQYNNLFRDFDDALGIGDLLAHSKQLTHQIFNTNELSKIALRFSLIHPVSERLLWRQTISGNMYACQTRVAKPTNQQLVGLEQIIQSYLHTTSGQTLQGVINRAIIGIVDFVFANQIYTKIKRIEGNDIYLEGGFQDFAIDEHLGVLYPNDTENPSFTDSRVYGNLRIKQTFTLESLAHPVNIFASQLKAGDLTKTVQKRESLPYRVAVNPPNRCTR